MPENRLYLPKESADILPEERGVAVIGSYGDKEDFFAMKGILLEALNKLGVYGVEFTANKENPTFHCGRCADISIGEKKIGVIGEISPAVLDNYGIGTRAYVATLDIADMWRSAPLIQGAMTSSLGIRAETPPKRKCSA